MTERPFSLREQSFGFRLGTTFLVFTLFIGLATSAQHLVGHHENRDGKEGLSFEDLEGAYHGVRVDSPLVGALERGHPEDMAPAGRDLLLKWLASDRISEDYDNLDLGDAAPAEVLDQACLACHARNSTDGDGIGQTVPLEYWDDVRAVAFSREVEPTDEKILVASAHTHALTMGALSIVVALLALGTRMSRRFLGFFVMVNGVALFGDLGSWFLARDTAAFVPLIAIAGTLWVGTLSLMLFGILIDLWRPR